MIGGTDNDDETSVEVYKYVVDTNVWSTVSSMPSARANHRACAFEGMIYVVGGTADMDLNSMLQYDPSDDTWYEMASMLQAWLVVTLVCPLLKTASMSSAAILESTKKS